MIQLFAGYDNAEAAGFHVFVQSVLENSSKPVSITPLHLGNLKGIYDAGPRDGSNAFIYSRFLVPYLMGYKGTAIFMDGADMLCRGDIAELMELNNPMASVMVVPHNYKTKHPVKYVGSQIEAKNEDYPRKNWSSVMIMNCYHYDWRRLDLDEIATCPGSYLHRLAFTEDRFIDFLPPEWNWLVDEYGVNENAKLLHWTAGMPGFTNYRDAMYAEEWRRTNARAQNVANRMEVLSG